MWILNFFYDIFWFSEDAIQNDLLLNIDSLRNQLNEDSVHIKEIPELNTEWLPEVLNKHSTISILTRQDWEQISSNLSLSFDKHIPDIITNNYDFLKSEEGKILETYFENLENKVKNILDLNNYCTTANLINILELIESSNLKNSTKTINNDFLKYIGNGKYNQSSAFFKDHLIRSLSIDENNPNTSEENEIKKLKSYVQRKSLIEGFLKKKNLF